MVYDVVVIGAGVIGAFIARELSRYNLKTCLLEKEVDVAVGTSSANSGIIHAGYDAKPGTLKARFNVRGNELMDRVSMELDVPFKRIGSLVLAFNKDDMKKIQDLYNRGQRNSVPNLEIFKKEQVKKMEPNVSDRVIGALYAPTAGIVCPYELTLGAVENAVSNGVDLMLDCKVVDIRVEKTKQQASDNAPGVFYLHTTRGEIRSKRIVNAAGLYADFISSMVGQQTFSINPRKGEYMLLDKNQGSRVGSVIFQPPSEMGKGILVTPTVDGNLLIGPNAQDVNDKEDYSTTSFGMNQVKAGALKSVPSIDMKYVITSFAGLRAVPSTGDFIISEKEDVKGFVNVAGIESPGLTSAPAIAEYVVSMLERSGMELRVNKSFNPFREPAVRFHKMDDLERVRVIKENCRYGRIVCRCEKVTEGEIVASIKRPAGARDLDGVKRRTRAGMGRCQGSFCTPRVAEILSRELKIPMERVTKKGKGSELLVCKTK